MSACDTALWFLKTTGVMSAHLAFIYGPNPFPLPSSVPFFLKGVHHALCSSMQCSGVCTNWIMLCAVLRQTPAIDMGEYAEEPLALAVYANLDSKGIVNTAAAAGVPGLLVIPH